MNAEQLKSELVTELNEPTMPTSYYCGIIITIIGFTITTGFVAIKAGIIVGVVGITSVGMLYAYLNSQKDVAIYHFLADHSDFHASLHAIDEPWSREARKRYISAIHDHPELMRLPIDQ